MYRKLPAARYRVLAALAVGLVLTRPASAVVMQEFMHETQQTNTVAQQLTLVWWMPPEFWDLSMGTNPNLSPTTVAEIHEIFRDYQVFAVVRVKTVIGGLSDLQTKEELVSHCSFTVAGKAIAPIAPDRLPGGMQTMIGALRPMLSNMMGQLGQSMELVVYPGAQDQKKLLDPLKAATFDYSIYDQTFHWHLPLASLLPKKVDPKTHEEFPGSYDFNPYTGGKLSSK